MPGGRPPKTKAPDFGARLAALRKQAGLTQRGYAMRGKRVRERSCRMCEAVTRRKSGLCKECEREDARRSTDAQRGFSIELGEYVRIPQMPTVPHSGHDA